MCLLSLVEQRIFGSMLGRGDGAGGMDDPADGVWGPGVGGALDDKHRQMCMAKFCTRCFWIDKGAALKQQVGAWLDFKLDFASRRAGMGCSRCSLAKGGPAMLRLGLFKSWNAKFATYGIEHTRKYPMKLCRLMKHTTCPGHAACEAIMADAKVPTDGVPGNWQEVEKFTISGNATSIEGGVEVGRHKLRKMQWCLAEAKRDWNRKKLQEATCISIMQDQRATRFVLRFRCVNDKLEVTTGLMDLSRVVGDVTYNGADAIRRATLLGIQRCCTPSRPPLAPSAKAPDVNVELAVLIASKIECFAADAAGDEQLAGRELSTTLDGATTTEIRDTIVKDLPNLKVVQAPVQIGTTHSRNHVLQLWLNSSARQKRA